MRKPGAGELNKLVTIQSLTQSKDEEGGMVDTWTDFVGGVNIWAKIVNLSGSERDATKFGGQIAVARTSITIRYLPGVLETMRISYKNKYYAIKHINNFNERDEFLLFDCEVGKNDGH